MCSKQSDFEEKAAEMVTFFTIRNYPTRIVTSALEKVRQIPRNLTLTQSLPGDDFDRPVVVLTNHPNSNQIKNDPYRKFEYLGR